MRRVSFLMMGGAALATAGPALAADALKFGPPPSWVTPRPVPAPKQSDAPVTVLLSNSQIAVEPGKMTTYGEVVFKIQNPQGLAAGNLSMSWQPATETVTVNKLQIRRGDKVIDVLASGQTFTILRRETNLDAAMLDGTLTGNIQPEGLQEGDIVEFATTTEQVDPVLKGHVEALFGSWNGTPIESAYTKLIWPSGFKLNVRKSAALPEPRRSTRDGKTVFEISATQIEPLIPPSGAPDRFKLGRLIEATDYSSWADLSNLMMPLYQAAAVIPATGPLRDEVEKIRASTKDPKRQAELALALVQDRLRYVALLMGQGGYVPASAETSWARRFGDCKAKTALLLAILHSLGIGAEPVLVQVKGGDLVGERLPVLALFNHVIVRAHIGGATYWLDGTRSGDTSLDGIPVPDFGWGLPVVRNAQLVRILPPPRQVPDGERRIEIDATAGVYAPAKVEIAQLYRGDGAIMLNGAYSQLTKAQRDELMSNGAKRYFDTFVLGTTTVKFDKAKRELAVTTSGTAKLGWKDGWLYVPGASLAFNPDFDRPAGPQHDAPFAVSYPDFERGTVRIKLPTGFAAKQELGDPVRETLAGVEYSRSAKVDGDMLTIETSTRSVVPEVAYKTAIGDEARLRALDKDDVYLRIPDNFVATKDDTTALMAEKPRTAEEYVSRASTLMDQWRFDDAIADLTQALELNPKSAVALADRGIARVWKSDYPAAERDLAAAQAIDPKNAVALRARGLMAERKGEHKAAVDAYTKALESEPGSAFALGHRALANHALGDEDKALADSEAALKDSPEWVDLRLMRANILNQANKRELAAAEAAKLTSDNAKSSYAQVGAARIYARLGMRTEAMQAFDRAIAIKPEAYIYLNRAQSRPFSDYSGRLADLDAALKLEPDNAETLAEKAEQLAIASDVKAALKLYDAAVKAAPDNRSVALGRALMLYKAGNKAEAEKLLAARRATAKTASDFNSLCWMKATRDVMLESALQDCQEAVKLKPDYGAAIDSLAFVKLRLGKIDEAIALYDQALTKRSESSSYMGRAIAYARKGDKAHADGDRAAALKLDPDAETRFAEYGLKL